MNKVIESNNSDFLNRPLLHHIGIKTCSTPDCIICFYSLNNNISALSCGHVFHTKCISEVLANQRKCPVCRIDVSHSFKLIFEVENVYKDTKNCNNCYHNSQAVDKLLKINQSLTEKIDTIENYLASSKIMLNKTLLALKQRNLEKTDFLNKRLEYTMKFAEKEKENSNLKEIITFLIDKNESKKQTIIKLENKISDLLKEKNDQRRIIKNLMSSCRKKTMKNTYKKSYSNLKITNQSSIYYINNIQSGRKNEISETLSSNFGLDSWSCQSKNLNTITKNISSTLNVLMEETTLKQNINSTIFDHLVSDSSQKISKNNSNNKRKQIFKIDVVKIRKKNDKLSFN